MSELHKDNSGYDLTDLFIGAEGTLGVITAATMKLVPAPKAHATAMLASPSLPAALTLDKVDTLLSRALAATERIDPGAATNTVAHLGDGNLHFTVFPTRKDGALDEALTEAIENIAAGLGGSFSAEHGIGLSKLPSMQRRKDPVALEMMRAVKAAFDPRGILNPGKTIPPA